MTVQYEKEWYTVDEESGYVTLALVLEGDTAIPVTVTVRTLDLLDSSVGYAATGELLKVCLLLCILTMVGLMYTLGILLRAGGNT